MDLFITFTNILAVVVGIPSFIIGAKVFHNALNYQGSPRQLIENMQGVETKFMYGRFLFVGIISIAWLFAQVI